ncbi:helix-turn-helix domain-containing protein [Helicobacter himalayensis]|uniref:helix-turn-helix domain-containing protein n=1 Tax=Helicobacter himalayensis TaxID=1591088 RepID=UPI0008304FA8|nr:helix-turn-helix domain-containing protein [Helicobacter himalayensis]
MIANKNEIKAFYLTHNLSIKEVAEHFKVSYRTLAHWVKSEKWEKGGAVKDIPTKENPIFKENANKVLNIAQIKLKNEINSKLVDIELEDTIRANLLESSVDEILVQVMSLNYIQKNIALSAVIAKDSLLRLQAYNQREPKPQNEPLIVACAEKCANLFINMQNALYGKNISNEKDNINDLSNLSIAELKLILDKV